jgi:hypothetical protein
MNDITLKEKEMNNWLNELIDNGTLVKKGDSLYIKEKHNCNDNAVYYEFIEDGHRYHGYECGICGEHLQSG